MNHVYGFTLGGSPWSALTLDLTTGQGEGYMPDRAKLMVRRASTRLDGQLSAADLRYLAASFLSAADALEATARTQNEDWLDRRAA